MLYLSSYQSSIPGLEKAFAAAKTEAFRRAVLFWHDTLAQQHFTLQAKNLYQYAPRREDYMKKKARFFHHQRPLEFTSRSKGMILSARRVEPHRWGARLHMMAPKYFYQYNPVQAFVNKVEELTAVAAAEEEALGKLIDAHITAGLQAEPMRVVAIGQPS